MYEARTRETTTISENVHLMALSAEMASRYLPRINSVCNIHDIICSEGVIYKYMYNICSMLLQLECISFSVLIPRHTAALCALAHT